MMGKESIHTKVADVIMSAKKHVLLTSREIEFALLERILNLIPDSVQEIDCIVRCAPGVATRFHDLEIINLIANRRGARLWNRIGLHAKYVRGDDRCLMGSTDLTSPAHGLHTTRNNVELMIEIPSRFPGLKEWESALFAGSSLVTPIDEILNQTGPETPQSLHPSSKIDLRNSQDGNWIPMCPCPEKIYGVYAGSIDKGEIAGSVYDLAVSDLRALNPLAGCADEKDFTAMIASRLMEMNAFHAIIGLCRPGIPDHFATKMLTAFLDQSHGIRPEDAWATMKRWIFHFFADEFKLKSHQEVLVKV